MAAHQQQRRSGGVQQLIGDAAVYPAAQAAVGVCRHHDQVGAAPIHFLGDSLRRVADRMPVPKLEYKFKWIS